MGLHDRPYMRQDGGGSYGGGGGVMRSFTAGLPRPTPVVKWMLIANLTVFVMQIFFDQRNQHFFWGMMSTWGGTTVKDFWQVWRYVTFQFLHADFWHIAMNMLGLYMLGTPLEQSFGSRRFLKFYLICGAFAGLAFVVLGAATSMDPGRPIIGASGGVFGIVLACAVLFPQFRLIMVFFPVPIRFAALIIFGGMILLVLQKFGSGQGEKAMSDVAHLGGAVAAAGWTWLLPMVERTREAQRKGQWERKLQRRAAEQAEVDGILDKIRESGMASLSRADKKKLREASQEKRNDL